jgi:hypothetical protein
VAVAILATGFDYTQPGLARWVARDGEGEPIAWDFAGNDPRPYLASPNETPPADGGDGTLLMRTVIERSKGRIRVLPVRVDPGRPVTLAQAVAFVARTPARIVLVPLWGERPEDWEPFRIAARHFRHLLFVVSVGDTRAPVFPAALALENMLVVTAIDRNGRYLSNSDRATVEAAIIADEEGGAASSLSPAGRAAAEAAVVAAEALQMLAAPVPGAELKRTILGAAQPPPVGAEAGAVLPPVLAIPDSPGSARPRQE